ncbi:unnamed protein product, partial [Tilletia controversa]
AADVLQRSLTPMGGEGGRRTVEDTLWVSRCADERGTDECSADERAADERAADERRAVEAIAMSGVNVHMGTADEPRTASFSRNALKHRHFDTMAQMKST